MVNDLLSLPPHPLPEPRPQQFEEELRPLPRCSCLSFWLTTLCGRHRGPQHLPLCLGALPGGPSQGRADTLGMNSLLPRNDS